jgi:RNA polymerase sigma-32 factor
MSREQEREDAAPTGTADRAVGKTARRAEGPGGRALARRGPDGKSTAIAPRGRTEIVTLDPLQLYMQEVRRYPLLSPEEERALAIRVYEHGDSEAARKMVTSNLRLVAKLAFEYRKAYKNVMDLIQEGNIGLLMAVKKFDPYRGVKFSSYAAWWIRAYILRYVLNNWRMVKIGTTQAQRKLFFNLHKQKRRLESMGIDPDAATIADELDVEEKEVVEMDKRLSSSDVSLDTPLGEGSERAITRLDLLSDSEQVGQDDLVALEQFNHELAASLASFGEELGGKERHIFEHRLMATDPATLQEIGDHYGITRERVRQIEARLLKKLREYLRESMPGHFEDELLEA